MYTWQGWNNHYNTISTGHADGYNFVWGVENLGTESDSPLNLSDTCDVGPYLSLIRMIFSIECKRMVFVVELYLYLLDVIWARVGLNLTQTHELYQPNRAWVTSYSSLLDLNLARLRIMLDVEMQMDWIGSRTMVNPGPNLFSYNSFESKSGFNMKPFVLYLGPMSIWKTYLISLVEFRIWCRVHLYNWIKKTSKLKS